MQQKLFPKTLLGLISILSAVLLHGQAPYTSALEKEFQGSFTIGNCNVSSITAKVRLSTLVGEPTVYANIKWRNGYGSSSDCLPNENFNVLIRIYSNYSTSYFYILADGAIGLIPHGDNTWGRNPLSGSPNWGELFMKDPTIRNPNKNNTFNFVLAENAKTIWKYGFTLSGVFLMDKSNRLYSIKD